MPHIVLNDLDALCRLFVLVVLSRLGRALGTSEPVDIEPGARSPVGAEADGHADYERSLEHQAQQPGQPVMSYAEFFRNPKFHFLDQLTAFNPTRHRFCCRSEDTFGSTQVGDVPF